MGLPLPGLYAIVDPDHCAGRDPLWVARAIIRGGCGALQLRAKGLPDRPLLALARGLRRLCTEAGVPFVLNDRVDLALLAEADGVHLGQGDLPLEDARAIAGRITIGLSTHSSAELDAALRGGADLVGFGPVFATTTKAGADPVVGLDGLREACRASSVPVVAIGGITRDNASRVSACGAHGLAVVSAVCGVEDPEAAARDLHARALGRLCSSS